jgi:membrane fusion protein, copper/silver efflux system
MKRNFLMAALLAAGWLFLPGPGSMSAVYAQGHAGHTAAPPSAAEKQKTVKPESQKHLSQEEASEELPEVSISAEQQKFIGVKTVKVMMNPMQKVIRTVGRIEADEQKTSAINMKIEGWIEKLYVDYTGRYVRKGEPLAEIYSPEVLATQRELISMVKWSKRTSEPASDMQKMLAQDADASLQAARQRLRLWDISEEQIKKLEETGEPQRALTLYSPVDGFIIRKMAVLGVKAMAGEKLFEVADLSTLWVIADIYEQELALIRTGQPAQIFLNYFPGRGITSRVDYIYPSIAADTRTAKVRLTLPNGDGRLKPQMFATVEIRADMGRRLSIPESAVIDTGTEQVVYVDTGNDSFEPRAVQLGVRSNGYAEVLRGLKNGEKVALSANFLIDSEAQLKGVKPLHRH